MVKVLACLSLCALVVGGFYHFDRDAPADTTWWENERYRMDLQQQIQITSLRLERREREGDAGKLGEATANLEGLIARFDKRMAEYEVLSKDLEETENAFLAFREKRLGELRAQATGREWPEFVSASGRVLKNAKVISVDDSGVTLRHQDGSARMRFEDLTEEHRCLFGLEEESAIAAMKEELRMAHHYEQWVRSGEDDAKIMEIVGQQEAARLKRAAGLKKPLPQAKRFRSAKPLPEVASNGNSPLNVRSLADPPRKVNQNPRFRVRGTPRYHYYSNYGSAGYSQGAASYPRMESRAPAAQP
ncbi:MAG: hypothetical protein EOP87_03070 [Verrucomicrobiaceae bacterium]|nr:MAG: hypothetical protein EOP87_03070 [Verrucomicrobiaceae bacterium]